MNELAFSIDFDAEIRKITERQQLNAIHFMVLLVRHALWHRPAEIQIHLEEGNLLFAQDGEPLMQAESAHLQEILVNPDSDHQAQLALGSLEAHFGIAMLSSFMNFQELSLKSGEYELSKRKGQFYFSKLEQSQTGYLLSIKDAKLKLNEIRKELDFYAGGSWVPIRLNGLPLAAKGGLSNQMVLLKQEQDTGRLEWGIPRQGEMNCLQYRKCGVIYGFSSSEPEMGQLYHGLWDDADPCFEPNYKKSSQQGQALLKAGLKKLYDESADHFLQLADGDKLRFRHLLFRFKSPNWKLIYGKLPLFDGAAQAFQFSLEALARMAERYGHLPYLPAGSTAKLDLPLPRLGWSEIWFLRDRFGIRSRIHQGLKLKLGSISVEAVGDWEPSAKASLKRNSLEFRFLNALKRSVPEWQFELCTGPSRKQGCVWQIEVGDPAFLKALNAWKLRPEGIVIWAYQLQRDLLATLQGNV